MHLGQRGLAHHQHQLAPLLEHDVGRAMHEVLAVAVGNPAEGAHRAGNDHHALGLERARRDRGAHVALAVGDCGESTHLLDGVAGLVLEGALRPFADDEMALDVAALERLEHPHAENGAGRAGHADDETPHSAPRSPAVKLRPIGSAAFQLRTSPALILASHTLTNTSSAMVALTVAIVS